MKHDSECELQQERAYGTSACKCGSRVYAKDPFDDTKPPTADPTPTGFIGYAVARGWGCAG